ncbi:hypothetical protein CPB83DRAFT_834823 [Crepidotus variabilis]|uniref:Uncharacterized protein n=1 Tax=Crepidotus variabilis TaxID=179855 RepID=A0A9P6JQI4_9AGAR|nr:hypothetical protein CPB83DRAFT_834823 [Crepidotus variabilis]
MAQHFTPELWTIYAATLTESNTINSIPFASAWLKRSGGLALYVRLSWHHPDDEPMSEVVIHSAQRIIDTVASHAQRLELLDIQLPSETLPYLSSTLSSKRLDSLKHLKLYFSLDPDDPDSILKVDASPRILTMEYGWLTKINIDWSRLTNFVAKDILNLEECIHLFQHASNLNFSDIHLFAATFPPQSPVNHPSLESLIIRDCGMGFWESFTFPSLESLHIYKANGVPGWNGLRDFVRRSGCKLGQLAIRHMEETDEHEIVHVFRATTELKQLSIQGDVLGGSILSEMDAVATSDTSGFLFKLEILTLVFLRLPFDWAGLVVLLVTMSSREAKSLRDVKVRLIERTPDSYDSLIGKTMLKHVMDASQSYNIRFVDSDGLDLLTKLRHHYIL